MVFSQLAVHILSVEFRNTFGIHATEPSRWAAFDRYSTVSRYIHSLVCVTYGRVWTRLNDQRALGLSQVYQTVELATGTGQKMNVSYRHAEPSRRAIDGHPWRLIDADSLGFVTYGRERMPRWL